MEYPKFKVCVRSFTYNQSAYITDTMNGFTMQETNYPFVCCIVDDCSTDGEQEVIRKYFNTNFNLEDKQTSYEQETSYATILYGQHKTNKNCYFAILLLKENYYSKKQSFKKLEYIQPWRDGCTYDALCEGDDYWIHPKKLQMQTDFLDNNPDYVLCHTDKNTIPYKSIYKKNILYPDGNYFPGLILNGNTIATLTTVFRSEIYEKLPHLSRGKGWMMGDFPLWIEFSKEGKIKYLPVITATYRILPQSASHGSLEKMIKFGENARQICLFYADYYGIQLPNDGYTKQLYIDCMKIAFKHNNIEVAKKYKAEADQKKMTSFKMYFFYYSTIIRPIGYLLHKILPY